MARPMKGRPRQPQQAGLRDRLWYTGLCFPLTFQYRSSHPVVTIRKCIDPMRDSRVNKIYRIFLPLNDSTNLIHDPEQGTEREPDKGDLVLRNAFQEFLVWTGDTDILARASTTEKIDTFLRHSTTELENYVKFLEAFSSGRPDNISFSPGCDLRLSPASGCALHHHLGWQSRL